MKYVYFSSIIKAYGTMLLPIRDMQSIILSSVLNLKISGPELYTYSLCSHSSKRVLPSNYFLSSAPENSVISQTFDSPIKICFVLKERKCC